GRAGRPRSGAGRRRGRPGPARRGRRPSPCRRGGQGRGRRPRRARSLTALTRPYALLRLLVLRLLLVVFRLLDAFFRLPVALRVPERFLPAPPFLAAAKLASS